MKCECGNNKFILGFKCNKCGTIHRDDKGCPFCNWSADYDEIKICSICFKPKVKRK